jgi:hypothetical protein
MDPNQVTQVFQRCPVCRTPVSPADARCPNCGRSLQEVVETTMPMPRLGADADPLAAPDATMPLPRLGNTAGAPPTPPAPPIATPDATVPMPTVRPPSVPRPAVAPTRAVYGAPPRPARRGFPVGLLLLVLLLALGVLVYLALARAAGVSVPLGSPLFVSGAPAPGTSVPASPSQWVVANTGGEGVYLRRTPRLDDRLVAWPDNTRLQDLGEQATGDGLSWRKVRDPRGNVGYVPTQWLAASQ